MPPCEVYSYRGATVFEDHHICLSTTYKQSTHLTAAAYGTSRAVLGATSVPETSARHVAFIQWSTVLLT